MMSISRIAGVSLHKAAGTATRRCGDSSFRADRWQLWPWLLAVLGLVFLAGSSQAAVAPVETAPAFPPPLESYGDSQMTELWSVLQHRVRRQPLNLWAALLFFGAILHAFFTHQFLHWAHVLDERGKAQSKSAVGGETAPRQTSTVPR